MKEVNIFSIGFVLLLLTAIFSSHVSPVTALRNEFPTEVQGQIIDIKVNSEIHQYLQYMTPICQNNFQLTHWEGCKYCQEKKRALNNK